MPIGPALQYPILILASLIAGVLGHILKKAAEARVNPGMLGVWFYLRDYPAATLSMLTATSGLCLALWSIDQLNGVTAFCVGYIGNSAVDLVANRVIAAAKIEVTPPKAPPP